jgi:hypothetical protein
MNGPILHHKDHEDHQDFVLFVSLTVNQSRRDPLPSEARKA